MKINDIDDTCSLFGNSVSEAWPVIGKDAVPIAMFVSMSFRDLRHKRAAITSQDFPQAFARPLAKVT